MKPSEITKGKIVPLYRVQGGKPPRASKKTINIDENGELTFDLSKEDAYVYIGSAEHMKYFAKKRTRIKESLSRILLESNMDRPVPEEAEVIVMYVPEWLPYLLMSIATTKDKNTHRLIPELADRRTPGDSYGICTWWIKILKEATLLAKKIEIQTYKDMIGVLINELNQAELENMREIDYDKIIKLLKRYDKYNPIPQEVKEKLCNRMPVFDQLLGEEKDI